MLDVDGKKAQTHTIHTTYRTKEVLYTHIYQMGNSVRTWHLVHGRPVLDSLVRKIPVCERTIYRYVLLIVTLRLRDETSNAQKRQRECSHCRCSLHPPEITIE